MLDYKPGNKIHVESTSIDFDLWSLTVIRYQCYCGNTYPSGENYALDASKCRTKCKGDKKQECGGSWTMDVYSLGFNGKVLLKTSNGLTVILYLN